MQKKPDYFPLPIFFGVGGIKPGSFTKVRGASSVVGNSRNIPQMVVHNGDLPW